VVEVERVDGKELGKESESIASEGRERDWEKGIRATERRTERGMMK
jgi:hypothetical protein